MSIEILVVDDSPAEQLYIGHFLSRHADLNVKFACSGYQALNHVEDERPHIIVSDLRMQGMNGLQLVQELRACGHNIPLILMTSYGSEKIAVQALEAGAASYVPKVAIETDLVSTIRSVLSVTGRLRERRKTLGCLAFSESHYILGNEDASVSHLISSLLDTAGTMKLLHGQEVTQVGVALQEAFSNAIYHGNLNLDSELRRKDAGSYFAVMENRRSVEPYMHRRVFVEARFSLDELRFVIRDEGSGFDVESQMSQSGEVNLDRNSGRGVLLINSFMDLVTHNELGNQITMVKYVTTTSDQIPCVAMKNERSLVKTQPFIQR